MGEDPSALGAPVGGAGDPEEIRQEIEATRQELGDTVEALAAKADIKARARERIESTKASMAHKGDELRSKARDVSPDGVASTAVQATHKAKENPLPLGIGGAFAVGFLVGRVTKRG